ncbi:unnamed protein product [Ranitomeya imitator]|uniref:Uncharacterized protein n=1 Tax=Ranitomeya imitator TaxID=111125 RepID=A0ABN9L6G5_9NEOB|nr:unnamed protein product [Ranitomeya imitator]
MFHLSRALTCLMRLGQMENKGFGGIGFSAGAPDEYSHQLLLLSLLLVSGRCRMMGAVVPSADTSDRSWTIIVPNHHKLIVELSALTGRFLALGIPEEQQLYLRSQPPNLHLLCLQVVAMMMFLALGIPEEQQLYLRSQPPNLHLLCLQVVAMMMVVDLTWKMLSAEMIHTSRLRNLTRGKVAAAEVVRLVTTIFLILECTMTARVVIGSYHDNPPKGGEEQGQEDDPENVNMESHKGDQSEPQGRDCCYRVLIAHLAASNSFYTHTQKPLKGT